MSSNVQCNGSVSAMIKFSGVSPEGLQRLHELQLEDENNLPISVEGTSHTFNAPGRFINITEAKLVTDISRYGYDVSIEVQVFTAHKVFSSNNHSILFAPIPKDLLLKIFLAVNQQTVPEKFAYVARQC